MLVSDVYLFRYPKGHILRTYTVTCLELIIIQISQRTSTWTSVILILIQISRRSYRTYAYIEVLNTYWYLYLFQISRRSLQNSYLSYGIYICSEVLVGITEITERILVLRSLFLYRSTRKYYFFKCPKRRTLMLISNLSYTHTGGPVGTTEFILIRSLYEDTRRYYRTYFSTSYLILVVQSLSLSYGSSTCTIVFILVFRILSRYYGAYTCILDFIHVLQNLYMYFRSYTCLTEYILFLRILYLFYRTYYCLTDLILVRRYP